MPTNVITSITKQGIKGYDRFGIQFGLFHGQISGVEKVPDGCRIRIDTGEIIPLDMCYNRVSVMLKDAKAAAAQ